MPTDVSRRARQTNRLSQSGRPAPGCRHFQAAETLSAGVTNAASSPCVLVYVLIGRTVEMTVRGLEDGWMLADGLMAQIAVRARGGGLTVEVWLLLSDLCCIVGTPVWRRVAFIRRRRALEQPKDGAAGMYRANFLFRRLSKKANGHKPAQAASWPNHTRLAGTATAILP